jgi:polygalacturonase
MLLLVSAAAFLFTLTRINATIVTTTTVNTVSSHSACSIELFGAVGDGVTDNQMAIQRALDTCHEVLIPAGKQFSSSPLNITLSNSVLRIEGALLAVNNVSNWPVMPEVPSYPVDRDVGGCCRFQPFLLLFRVQNVSVVGGGTIDGQGAWWWAQKRAHTLPHGRPRLVETMWSQNIRILNVSLHDSPFWTTHLWASSDLEVGYVNISAPATAPNTDGVDPDSSSRVWIHHIDCRNGDDGIAVKSGLDAAGQAFGVPCTDVLVEDSHFHESHGLSVGSEVSGGVSNITFRNIALSLVGAAGYVKTAPARGAYIRNVLWEDITISFVGMGIKLSVAYDKHPAPPNTNFTVIDNLVFRRLKGTAGIAGDLLCSHDIPCKNVAFDDVHIESLLGFSCKSIEGTQHNTSPEVCGLDKH